MTARATTFFSDKQPMPDLHPGSYPRRILVAVTGLSPQIVTETVYALAVKQTPPFIPTEVHLITTTDGRERARLSLLSDSPGHFQQLRHDYGLPEIIFSEENIHVLSDSQGRPLSDIRSLEDNAAAADLITAILATLTADPTSAVHVSIAGGRKTMGFYMGYALTLFGRPQDRLSHVLVSSPFESSHQFYYPTPNPHVIELSSKALADSAEAEVTLAEIPFVSLRDGFPSLLLEGQATYNQMVEAGKALRLQAPPSLKIDLWNAQIEAGGKSFSLTPSSLAMLAVFARRLIAGEPPLGAPKKGVQDIAWAARYLDELKLIRKKNASVERTEEALKKGMDGEYFSTALSRLHKQLSQALGSGAIAYAIDDGDCTPRSYSLRLPVDAVTFAKSERFISD